MLLSDQEEFAFSAYVKTLKENSVFSNNLALILPPLAHCREIRHDCSKMSLQLQYTLDRRKAAGIVIHTLMIDLMIPEQQGGGQGGVAFSIDFRSINAAAQLTLVCFRSGF